MKHTIESTFHDLRAEVEVPDHVRPMLVVTWLHDHDPEALKKVCQYEGCCCEIDVLDDEDEVTT